MKYILLFLISILSSFSFASPPTNFTKAKEVARTQIYADQNTGSLGTIYCGCDWAWTGKSGGRVDLDSCGYKIRKQKTRAERIEWEHIVPASWLGQQRQCWQNGGRKNCVKTDPVFRAMEADLYNLAPSIGEMNADRGNLRFGIVSGGNQYGRCTSKVDFKTKVFEPRDEVKGFVARVHFYMYAKYNLKMSKQQRQLLEAWDKQFPAQQWEIERNHKIIKSTIQ